MHRIGSGLLAVALGATALGGLAWATTQHPDAQPPLAVAAAAEEADPSPSVSPTPAPASASVDLSAPWRGPANSVLAGIMEDFPDDVAEARLEGDVPTVASSGAAPAEVVERLRALERPYDVQEGLGISSVELNQVVGALSERTLVVAPDRTFAIGASVRDRAFTVDIGASSSDDPSDLRVDVDELEDRIRAGIPAADLAGFDVVVTVDPRFTIGY
ncbi:hypothetical protein [Clavibacter michiganensis]|uniref:Pterin-binding domain-containing protein n=1 Tax=Clavibacter michiganensis subsp. insidiosus TaxID=33014 RepID=A0A0D5CKC4_9MICO|nr:hypothetical protein [Clavibacter michiganensis]AJW80111.1 hypothetical protein VO01_14160 [Clavibacter michiganensis subsp. insidiosus]AWF97231.1 hypothetical protein BEH61_01795 [Clavibacter michiganensis subsp. insidiosus]AWG02681.1 hypothetical protein BEH62_13875 [Clavibacter michiganensis subsp. insidiosus]OQJ58894.1 hypothetical protein B5P21_02505 [Clavibacter michiganensis subsp. insidiosus]RII86719.1 hypothetical protein DZF92_09575 [Clavibacter michiganensis subsp. insidiosus]